MPPKGWVFSISESWKILIGHEKVMEKSLNFIAQFLYEPCKIFSTWLQGDTSLIFYCWNYLALLTPQSFFQHLKIEIVSTYNII